MSNNLLAEAQKLLAGNQGGTANQVKSQNNTKNVQQNRKRPQQQQNKKPDDKKAKTENNKVEKKEGETETKETLVIKVPFPNEKGCTIQVWSNNSKKIHVYIHL